MKTKNRTDQNLEANLLSCLIQDPGLIRSLDVSSDLFSREAHRRIFIVLSEMEEEGVPIDPATVSRSILDKEWEEFCGKPAFILDLFDLATTTANASYYAECLARLSLSRKILLRLEEVRNVADSPDEAALVLSSILEMAAKDEKDSEILTPGRLWEEVIALHETGKKRGLSTGWTVLDDYFKLRPGELTVATGIPGSGKSAFFDNVAVNMATLHGWRTLFYSAENFPVTNHLANLLEISLGLPFNPGARRRMDLYEIGTRRDFFQDHFLFLDPEYPSVDRLLFLALKEHQKKRIDFFVIDPWNQLAHSQKEHTETQQVALSLGKIRKFARKNQIHIAVVAHPMKLQKDKDMKNYPVPTLYDIAGSSHFRNMADNGLVLWRDFQSSENLVEVHVQKIRFREVGKIGMGKLTYDRLTGIFR